MTITVVDGNDLPGILADAGVEAVADAPADKVADKPAADAKAAEKTDVAAKTDATAEPDDIEDDEGITPRQRREMTTNMLKALAKKHRRQKEAEEFAADQVNTRKAAEERAADLDRQLTEARSKLQPAKEVAEPKREDFKTDDEFIEASSDWKADQKIAKREQERAAEERQASVKQQFQRAAELVPDFESTVSKQLNYPGAVVGYMRESDMFAELGYHFAKNPGDLDRLNKLPPVRQLVELGKIESKLSPFGSSTSSPKDGDKPNGKATAAAPSTTDTGFSPSKPRSDAPVIKPLTSSDASQVEPDAREMTTRQQIEQFQRKKGVNLNARKRH